jgi:isocitrate/isopropylmalate dehydrogenase
MFIARFIFVQVLDTAPDIAEQDKVNHTALLLSAVMVLRYVKLESCAGCTENACLNTIKEGKIFLHSYFHLSSSFHVIFTAL